MSPMSERNDPGDQRCRPARSTCCSAGVVVARPAGQRADADREQQRTARTRPSEWPRENQKPHRQRPLPVVHQLPGGVVDGRDVVGVEGVPHAQRVRGEPEPDAEHAGGAERVVRGADADDQRDPADDVQHEHEPGHAGRPAPLVAGSAGRWEPPEARCRSRRRNYLRTVRNNTGGAAGCGVPHLARGRATRPERGDRTRGPEFTIRKQRRAVAGNRGTARFTRPNRPLPSRARPTPWRLP